MVGQEKLGNSVWMLSSWNLIHRQMYDKSSVFLPACAHVALLSCSVASVLSTQCVYFALYTVSYHSVPVNTACNTLAQMWDDCMFLPYIRSFLLLKKCNSLMVKNKTFNIFSLLVLMCIIKLPLSLDCNMLESLILKIAGLLTWMSLKIVRLIYA